MPNLSIEAIVAIVGIIVGLPPAALVIARYLKRRAARAQEDRGGMLLNTTPRLRPPPHHFYAQPFYPGNGVSNPESDYGSVEEQYVLSQTITFRRSSPYHHS
ncbi:hypothetical protein F4802DRAFT_540912 [Xylaria palmicola]|nr:hypothetical protein F4802DRAFT_540912 [Xylaria palmicola]